MLSLLSDEQYREMEKNIFQVGIENLTGQEQFWKDWIALLKTKMFWNYFQRWKPYFPMEQSEKKKYLEWAEPIVYGRADAIVGGQRRNHYCESAQLLAMVGDVKESLGIKGAKNEIFAVYKKKFPRHSSFQQEMKIYFGF